MFDRDIPVLDIKYEWVWTEHAWGYTAVCVMNVKGHSGVWRCSRRSGEVSDGGMTPSAPSPRKQEDNTDFDSYHLCSPLHWCWTHRPNVFVSAYTIWVFFYSKFSHWQPSKMCRTYISFFYCTMPGSIFGWLLKLKMHLYPSAVFDCSIRPHCKEWDVANVKILDSNPSRPHELGHKLSYLYSGLHFYPFIFTRPARGAQWRLDRV